MKSAQRTNVARLYHENWPCWSWSLTKVSFSKASKDFSTVTRGWKSEGACRSLSCLTFLPTSLHLPNSSFLIKKFIMTIESDYEKFSHVPRRHTFTFTSASKWQWLVQWLEQKYCPEVVAGGNATELGDFLLDATGLRIWSPWALWLLPRLPQPWCPVWPSPPNGLYNTGPKATECSSTCCMQENSRPSHWAGCQRRL